ncbi:MAG: trypsin-like peptidase domain-containing protein [Clostridia bacterium]|nr:trypsin-like peptidase domain-containing protein [Clostridia bacterium]
MSNYIYNDNFNYRGNNSEQPNDPKRIIVACLLICVFLTLFSGVLGVFIGIEMSKNSSTGVSNNNVSMPTNTVYHTTVYKNLPLASDENGDDSDEKTRADTIADIKDSVVEIKTQYVVQSFYQQVKEGAGSGVIVGQHDINGEGYFIITNAHVIAGTNTNEIASEITVTLTDGTEYEASVFGYDPVGDIAVLTINEPNKELKIATFINSSDAVRVGEDVIVIGNPLGSLGGSVTNGYVSALDREINVDGTIMNLMQTDAAVNPGNSGGGIFNLKGELIGIVNAKSSGTGIEGIGFAIPSDDAYKILTDFIQYGYVTGRPTIGISCVKNGSYIQIVSIKAGTNDDILQIGDKICYARIPGSTSWVTATLDSLDALVNSQDIGDKLEICFYRNGYQYIETIEIFEYIP